MNLLEAIEQAGDNWFRPVHWKNSGMAYQLSGDSFVVRANHHDGIYGLNLAVSTITGEWEIVTPEQVMSERK